MQHSPVGSFTRADWCFFSARWPFIGTCTHPRGYFVFRARQWSCPACNTCLWKGEQLTEYTGPAWGEKASSAGALRGTEPPGRGRAGPWAEVEHRRQYPPSTPTTNTPASKGEKDSEVTPTAASPQATWAERDRAAVSCGSSERHRQAGPAGGPAGCSQHSLWQLRVCSTESCEPVCRKELTLQASSPSW